MINSEMGIFTLFVFFGIFVVYPKVKVRKDAFEDDYFMNDHARNSLLPLRDFQSLSINDSCLLQDGKQKGVPLAPVVRVPKSDLPNVRRPASAPKIRSLPRVTEEDGKNDKRLEEARPNIRVSSVMRPRAVVSSKDNDAMIGSKNRALQERHSSLDHGAVGNRHKSQSHILGRSPINRRSSKDDADCSTNLGRKNVSAMTVLSLRKPYLTENTKHSSMVNRDF